MDNSLQKIKVWATRKVSIRQSPTDILGLLRNSFRIPQNDIIAILEALVPSLKHYYEELADIIFGAIDYTAAQIDQQHRVIAVLFTIVKIRIKHASQAKSDSQSCQFCLLGQMNQGS
ncbi:hypothetical protein V3472_09375 [Lacticaseibacillus rhamnosus]